jgi:DNA polymerase-1
VEIIPLYATTPTVAVQDTVPVDIDGGCTACSMHKGVHSVCFPARLSQGHDATGRDQCLYVVGETPSAASDRMRRPFEGKSERWFRSMLRRHWHGDVVLDYALRCSVGRRTVNHTHHNHCRPYMAAVLEGVSPARILTLGNHAAKGLLGYDRGGASHVNRRGYAWLYPDDVNGIIRQKTPVFLLSKPSDPCVNKFYRTRFEDDLIWALTSTPPEPPLDGVTFALDPTEADAEFARDFIAGSDWIAVDVETYGLQHDSDFRLLSVGIAIPGEDDCISLGEDALAPGTPTRQMLVDLLVDPRLIKKGQNVKYDHQSLLLALGVDPTPIFGDSRLQYKLLNPDGVASLDHMAELVGMGGHKQEAGAIVEAEARRLRAAWKAANPELDARNYHAEAYAYAALPRDVNLRYVSRDALTTAKLIEKFEPTLKRAFDGVLWDTYTDEVNPVSVSITHVENRGVGISGEAVQALGTFLIVQLEGLEGCLPPGINPASSKEVQRYIYGPPPHGLGIKPTEFTKTNQPSTNKATLERLGAQHKSLATLLEWRQLEKLRTTYVEGLLPHIRPDGRIHPTLLLDGTGTGRLSCKNPNLQNQPSRGGDLARMVKDCFVAGLGRMLLQVDYGTLEIRVAAMLSRDPRMIEILQDPMADFHLETAKQIGPMVWGMTAAQIEQEYRNGEKAKRAIAKTINFGTLYGQSPFALALQISSITGSPFSADDAEKAQRAILGNFVVLREWIRDRRMETMKHGAAWTWWDGRRSRRRPLYAAGFSDSKRSGTALRSAFNTPVQGSGSAFCLRSLATCEQIMRHAYGARCFPVLTVHDSILFELDHDLDLLEDVVELVEDVMTSWPSGDVPLTVDFEAGLSWGSLHKLKVEDGVLLDLGNLEIP